MTPPYVCVAVRGTPNWWPLKPTEATQIFGLDIAGWLRCGCIDSISAQCAPYGAGELIISGLAVQDETIFLTTSSGQPERVYKIELKVRASDGETIVFRVEQGVPRELPGFRVPVPPNPGFGPAIVWPTLIGFAGHPIFARPRPPSCGDTFAINPALIGGF